MPPPLPAAQLNLRQRFSAMRNIPPFLREIWGTSKPLTIAAIGIRLIRAFLPIITLYIGKLIIDEAVRLIGIGVPHDLAGAWRSGELNPLAALLGLEFALAIGSDLLGRLINYANSLLSELFTDAVKSVKAP